MEVTLSQLGPVDPEYVDIAPHQWLPIALLFFSPATDCDAVNDPRDGNATILQGEGQAYGSVIQFFCEQGYEQTTGEPIIYCQQDGTWSNTSTPECSGKSITLDDLCKI